jgi:hypothetical protein
VKGKALLRVTELHIGVTITVLSVIAIVTGSPVAAAAGRVLLLIWLANLSVVAIWNLNALPGALAERRFRRGAGAERRSGPSLFLLHPGFPSAPCTCRGCVSPFAFPGARWCPAGDGPPGNCGECGRALVHAGEDS